MNIGYLILPAYLIYLAVLIIQSVRYKSDDMWGGKVKDDPSEDRAYRP